MIRRIQYILLLMGILCTMQPARAQDNSKALTAAIDTIIRKYSQHARVVDDIVEGVYEKFKKNPKAIIRISKSYYSYFKERDAYFYNYHTRDTANAFKYIHRALKADSTYIPAYLHAGKIETIEKNFDEAKVWYEKALAINPHNGDIYSAYAEMLEETDMDAAIALLQKGKEQVAGFPAELIIARLYRDHDRRNHSNENMRNITDLYGKSNLADMDLADISEYAINLFYGNNAERALEVAEFGLKKAPKDFVLNRVRSQSLLFLKRYKESLDAAQDMFQADNAKPTTTDYIYYTDAIAGLKKYDQAIQEYEKIMQTPDISESDRDKIQSRIGNCIKGKVTQYTDMGEYAQAEAMMERLLNDRAKRGEKPDGTYLDAYAQIYMTQAEELNGSEKAAALMKADRVYDRMTKELAGTNNELYALNKRYEINALILDPDMEKGLGKPIAEKMIAALLARSTETPAYLKQLPNYYWYLCYYYATKQVNKKLSIEYANKMLAINPDDNRAQQILKALK